MNEFNLKKKNMRREAHFDKSNLLTKNGSDLIANKFNIKSNNLQFLVDSKINIGGSFKEPNLGGNLVLNLSLIHI